VMVKFLVLSEQATCSDPAISLPRRSSGTSHGFLHCLRELRPTATPADTGNVQAFRIHAACSRLTRFLDPKKTPHHCPAAAAAAATVYSSLFVITAGRSPPSKTNKRPLRMRGLAHLLGGRHPPLEMRPIRIRVHLLHSLPPGRLSLVLCNCTCSPRHKSNRQRHTELVLS